jgi:hypothetical protein
MTHTTPHSPYAGATAVKILEGEQVPGSSGVTPIADPAHRSDTCRIGGYLVVWGDQDHRDLHGEYFTPGTELALD